MSNFAQDADVAEILTVSILMPFWTTTTTSTKLNACGRWSGEKQNEQLA